jgi:hypothetical protein
LKQATVRISSFLAGAEGGPIQGMRLAYTVQGDCDPASTDRYPPTAPDGGIGHTLNNWSLCVVTVPVPPQPKLSPNHQASTAGTPVGCGNADECNRQGTQALKSADASGAIRLFKLEAGYAEAYHNTSQTVLAYNNLAIAYMHLKDYTNALDSVHHALGIDAENSSAKYNLQLIEKAMGGANH